MEVVQEILSYCHHIKRTPGRWIDQCRHIKTKGVVLFLSSCPKKSLSFPKKSEVDIENQ